MDELFEEKIPLAEAADFFIRVKTAGWPRRMEAKETIKEAFDISAAPGGPKTEAWEGLETRTLDKYGPIEGRRRNAYRRMIWKSRKPFRDAHTATLKEKGRQRGVTSLSAEATRKKGRRGQRAGEVIGGAAGGLTAAAAARKLLGADAKGMAAAALAGMVGGKKLGKEVGTELDIKKNAAAMRLKLASMKMANPQLMPVNYLGAEMAARKAQEANESAYYRSQLADAQAAVEGMQQEIQASQEQAMQLQQQAQMANDQIQQATSQAVAAQDQATQNAVQAANMRIGFQRLREQVVQAASMEPEQLAAPQQPAMGAPAPGALGAQPPADPGMQPPPGPEGPATQAPSPGTPPDAAPAAQGENAGPEAAADANMQQPAGPEEPQTKVSADMKSHAMWAIPGALAGAVNTASQLKEGLGPSQDKIKELEAQEGGFAHALRIAKAKADLAYREAAQKHPAQAIGMGALKGGAASAALGPKAMEEIQRSGSLLSELKGLKR